MKIQNLILVLAANIFSIGIAHADGVQCSEGYVWEYDTCEAPDFNCVSQSMQAYDSDVFYNWSAEQIDAALKDPKAFGHDVAVNSAQFCNRRDNR